MASSSTTVWGTLPPYFRLNYLPSIPASLIFLSFPLHINSSSFPIPSPLSKPRRRPIHLTLLCSAYSSSYALLSSPSSSFAFLWIPGHINLAEDDAVDLAAKQSLLFIKINKLSLSPAHGLKTYYRSFINSSWYKTWHTQALTKLRSIKKFTGWDPQLSWTLLRTFGTFSRFIKF